MGKEPLYPHVPRGTRVIHSPEDLARILEAEAKEEEETAKNYKKLAARAEALGAEHIARQLDEIAEQELRHAKILKALVLGLTSGVGDVSQYAKMEENPIRKFCCRLCGECAPSELLEEGRFLDRISWLKRHYFQKHPGVWGKGA